MPDELTHLDLNGQAKMVDVGDKIATKRYAIAKGEVVMNQSTLELVQKGALKKGDLFTVAKVAGINAVKRTAELIPLCHPLPVTHIDISFTIDEALPGIRISSIVKTFGVTGVEMEALTGVAIAALTIYDMAKAVEKTMKIQNIRLVEKRGGKSDVITNE